jgi:ubiquinone/menaquinone biosynthesis C-methylase UbiE
MNTVAQPLPTARSAADPDWVSDEGWYAPHDYWLSLCGLYEHYRFGLQRLGALQGRQLLDCGCGQGHTSVMLAKRGAQVSAFDIAQDDLATAAVLAQANGVPLNLHTLVFEDLAFADASFDLAFGACVLHHVQIPQAMAELQRVLKPGGRAVFIENSARNPLLMWARKRLVGRLGIPRYGDDLEHPLRASDFQAMRENFKGTVQVHYPSFVLFRLIDFYILRKRLPAATWLLRAADALCQRIPLVREYGYFLVVQLDRHPENAA